ncbi:MAG: hypothetical protein WC707_06120 [Candidatus Babeliaceae bacterium]|jgi:hypothetical protein
MKMSLKIVSLCLLSHLTLHHAHAVMLKNGVNVPQEAVDKVTKAIDTLRKDASFEHTMGTYEVPPKVLTEGLYALGKKCKDGCEINLEQFRELVHAESRVQRYPTIKPHYEAELTEEQKNLINLRIVYVYAYLAEFNIIHNNSVSKDDGAVLNASILGGLDPKRYGVGSRGFDYTDPVYTSLFQKIIRFFSF